MTSKEAYFQDLESIVTDQVYLAASRDELENEIAENMWTIGVSEELAGAIAPAEVQAFLQRVKCNRRTQLAQRGQPGGLRYYLWHDPQAGQLRFNFISVLHEALPFRAPVNACADEAAIIRAWLQDSGGVGAPLLDSADYRVQVYEEVLLNY
ncbi:MULTISPECIES: hypothetical protein [Hymenobacter]|uniref:Uncharacterized protein n=3 Tax=Hymenobacter TaxID=89966 RepID=A0A7Y7PQA7_9BACT|nr:MULTISPECIES: hypothetical protein [Hymenobacter]NVO32081.1 hypothetical protein [Hymenobacter lapidiphilus]NVO86339.1 hypothetical protein [Hymenobacter terrestris]OWP61468.1 hypothetical protein CDA63_19270 [Hymenobacter amundsenii]